MAEEGDREHTSLHRYVRNTPSYSEVRGGHAESGQEELAGKEHTDPGRTR